MNFSNDDDDLVSSGIAESDTQDEEAEIQAGRKRVWRMQLALSVFMLVLLSAICGLFFVSVPREQSYDALRKFVPFLATATATATPTPTALFDDHSRDYFATATAYPLANGPDDYREEFVVATDTWCEGAEDDNWSANSFQFLEGEYVWEVTAKRNLFLRCTIEETLTLPERFYLAADVAATGVENAQAALVFRKTEYGSYYVFNLYPAQQAFVVYRYHDEEWVELIPYSYSALVDSTGPNRLAVLADGARYVFFINGEYAGHVFDDTLSAGAPGLGISLDEGETARFVFDNFEIKYP